MKVRSLHQLREDKHIGLLVSQEANLKELIDIFKRGSINPNIKYEVRSTLLVNTNEIDSSHLMKKTVKIFYE